MAKKTVQRVDGKGVLRDANGNPWDPLAFENDLNDEAMVDLAGKTDLDDDLKEEFAEIARRNALRRKAGTQ